MLTKAGGAVGGHSILRFDGLQECPAECIAARRGLQWSHVKLPPQGEDYMGRWPGFRRWARLSALLAALLVCREGFGQEDEDHDEQPLAPGLVASYASEHGPRAIRLDERLSFHWHDGVPDERISAGLFSARWRGHLLAQGSGEYRLYVFAAGEVEVRLGGKIAIPRQRLESAWAASE